MLALRKVKSIVGVGAGGVLAFGGIGLWTGNEKFFKQFVSPVLDRIDPEFSHRAAVSMARFGFIRAACDGDSPNLQIKIANMQLSNPVGLAAGFDKSAECVRGMAKIGLGWVEIGSVTPRPQEGNPKPRIFRLPEDNAVINRYGFNNDGKEIVRKRLQEFKQRDPNYTVGVNLGANKDSPDRIKDYCEGVEAFSDTADYFVINISSPNTPNLRDLQKSESLPELLQRVINTRNAQERNVPIFLKVAPDLKDEDIRSISKTVLKKESRVDGLIVSNTTISRNGLASNLKDQIGGLSGKPLEKTSTELVGKFYKEIQGQIPIIGVGGVWSGEDAYNKICAGASAVQMYTALVYNGPGVVTRIKKELSDLLKENGFQSVQQAVGSSHRRTDA
ncbi:unnamed protein product [Allacma fusca]|uniref:Dihydroorotate dehydrogenase (quinone), mitochondrial n=1 Tax=Allacma fusca TaxID=39272 RepID=A0A8J2LLY1_9HEXA|nr:unnamed protein product [Allacma fusca]